jgi:hypothetical protein
MEEGGDWLKLMETTWPVIVTVATTVFVESAVAVAVMVTVLPGGTEAGAV